MIYFFIILSLPKSLYKRYSIYEIKHQVIEILKNNPSGMSSVELADNLKINRMTMSKYLNILSIMGLIKKRKIGSVNIWTLEPGIVENSSIELDFLNVQQHFINTLLTKHKIEAQKILLNLLYSNSDKVQIIKNVIIPTYNTINELYNRGKLGKTEKILLITNLLDLLHIFEFNYRDQYFNIHCIFLSGTENQVPNSKISYIVSSLLGYQSTYLGNVENYIDPFFDIDLQRFVSKKWKNKKGLKIIFIYTSEESSLRFLFTSIHSLKSDLHDDIKISLLVHPDLLSVTRDFKSVFVTTNLNEMLSWMEKIHINAF